jgi:cytochrome b involved in lipid metabolism
MDLREFAKTHPGGTTAIFLFSDATELFEQFHLMNDNHHRALKRFIWTLNRSLQGYRLDGDSRLIPSTKIWLWILFIVGKCQNVRSTVLATLGHPLS